MRMQNDGKRCLAEWDTKNVLENHMKQTMINANTPISSDGQRKCQNCARALATCIFSIQYVQAQCSPQPNRIQCHTNMYMCNRYRLWCALVYALAIARRLPNFISIQYCCMYKYICNVDNWCVGCVSFAARISTAAHFFCYCLLSFGGCSSYELDSGIGSFFEPFSLAQCVSKRELYFWCEWTFIRAQCKLQCRTTHHRYTWTWASYACRSYCTTPNSPR